MIGQQLLAKHSFLLQACDHDDHLSRIGARVLARPLLEAGIADRLAPPQPD